MLVISTIQPGPRRPVRLVDDLLNIEWPMTRTLSPSLAARANACRHLWYLECHGDPYGSLLDLWYPAMQQRMSVVSAFVTAADTTVRTRGSSQAVSLVNKALAHVRLVSEAKGLHNIPAAHCNFTHDDVVRSGICAAWTKAFS